MTRLQYTLTRKRKIERWIIYVKARTRAVSKYYALLRETRFGESTGGEVASPAREGVSSWLAFAVEGGGGRAVGVMAFRCGAPWGGGRRSRVPGKFS